jgi:hypothetical protein
MAIKFVYNPNFFQEYFASFAYWGIFSVVCFLIYFVFVKCNGVLYYIATGAFGLAVLPWLLILDFRSHCDLVHEVIYSNEDDVNKVVVKRINCVGNNFDIKFKVNDDGSLSEADDKDYIEVSVKFIEKIERRRSYGKSFVTYYCTNISFAEVLLCKNKLITIYNTEDLKFKYPMCFNVYSTSFKGDLGKHSLVKDLVNEVIEEYKLMKFAHKT